MPSYCGCGTPQARGIWVCCGFFGALTVVMWIIVIVFGSQCGNELDARGCSSGNGLNNNDDCAEDISECRTTGIVFWMAVIASVIASIPCYAMCCCNKPPAPATQVAYVSAPPGQAVGTPANGAPVAVELSKPAGQYGQYNQYGGNVSDAPGGAHYASPAV